MSCFIPVTDSPAGDDLSIERSVLAGMRVEKVNWHDEISLITSLRNADGVMCMHAPLTRAVVQSLPCCRVIARFGSGLDNIDLKAAEAAGISVFGVKDYCIQEVANHTMALVLAWNRKIMDYHHFVSEKRWNERKQTTGNWGCGPLSRLSRQTLGILGLGRIGREVAKRACVFGMTVLAYTSHPDPEIAHQLGIEFTSQKEVLGRSDFVSLHLPLTSDTRHLINSGAIRLMKSGAVLINTSRGGLVDDHALVDALREGHLSGALLDVYDKAPLPIDHPFRMLTNVILTPHVAFYSEESLVDLRRSTAQAVLNRLQ